MVPAVATEASSLTLPGRFRENRHSMKSARPGAIFFGLSSFQALAMFRRGIFYTFLGVYMRTNLGLSVTETTLYETIPMILNIAFQTFVWGRLTDRLQLRRSLIVAGEALASAGHVAMWYLHSIAPSPRAAGYAIIGGLAVIEIFWSMSNIGWSAYISDVYSASERNAVQGRLASVGGAGRILGAMIAGLLYDGLGRTYPGWGFAKGGIFFASSIAMLVSIVPLLFIPEGGIAYRGEREGAAAPAGGEGTAREGRGGGIAVFALFVVAIFLVNSGLNSLAGLRAQYLDLEEGFAASARTVSLVLNVESAALIVVGFLLGSLGRRMGIEALLLSGSGLGVLALLLYAAAPGLWLVYAASVLKGVADGCISASAYAFASTLIPPERRGRYFAIYNAAFFLSWGLSSTLVTGPIIDGLLAAGRGAVFSYRMGMLSSAALALAGLAILALLLRARKGRRAAGGLLTR